MAYQIQAKLLLMTGFPISVSSNSTSVIVGQRGHGMKYRRRHNVSPRDGAT